MVIIKYVSFNDVVSLLTGNSQLYNDSEVDYSR